MRKLQDKMSAQRFAKTKSDERLPISAWRHTCNMIKRGPDIDNISQRNKARNISLACCHINGLIIKPGETFSFWHLVGKPSKHNGYLRGRVLINGTLDSDYGGGLCNLANSLHILFMHSPLTIVELHHHSDALAPDSNSVRTPYDSGTSVNYNFLDLRARNDSGQSVQILVYCKNDNLIAELRAEYEFPYSYRIVEENHHFCKETDGHYYRISKIYRETVDKTTGKIIHRELKWDNHSRVMFDRNQV